MIKYLDKTNKVEVHFYNGTLVGVFPVFPGCDMIDWEALRREIPMFEEQLDLTLFSKL